MEEQNKELFYDLINNHKRDICATILGTSIPTLQRWIANDEWPTYVDIILEQRQDIHNLTKLLEYEKYQIVEVKQTVSNFVNASQVLKDLVSD